MPLASGSRLGPYQLLGPLGAGGMGEVYAARDERLSREVALKVLPADVASDAARLKRFEKEARSASALNHPNIVTIYDIGSSDAVSYIVMERVEGKTLRELLFAGALPVRKLLSIAAQVADGLGKAHEAGIVHRDLKPENIMVTRDGIVKILDFGLAKLTSAAPSEEATHLPTETGTSPGVVLGTVGYMSPEQAAGQPLDFRSDQFSLGSILYEMATGRRAFHKATAVDTLSAILHEEPEPVGRVSPQAPAPLRWTVERCLSKDPAERYASTRDLARDLSTIRDRISESASLEGPTSHARWRSTTAWGTATLVALCAGILAGKSLWKKPGAALPKFQQLSFGEETVQTARFGPDGQTIVYGVVREGKPFELYSTRAGNLESRPLGLNADVLSISASGEMALLMGGPARPATLARMPLAGGAPREMLEGVTSADWSPDGKSLAVVRVDGPKKRLEFPVGKVLFESTSFIGAPRVSRTGDRVLFSDSGSLAMVDPARDVRALAETLGPSGYAWSPAKDEVWTSVVFGSTTELHALPTGGPKRVIATLPGTFLLQDVSRGGRVLAERLAGGARMMCLAPGQAREADLSWLDLSDPADISADGTAVLFNESGLGGGGSQAVYLRRTDGSPAVRLGEGTALALSPDGKWALARRGGQTELLPTGAGEPLPVLSEGVAFEDGATFLPDGRLLLSGSSPGHGARLYTLEIPAGRARPASPEGVSLPPWTHAVSPDGALVAAVGPQGTWAVYSVDEGAGAAPRPIAGLRAEELPVRWSADGHRLFVLAEDGALSRLDPATGRREIFKEFRPRSRVFPTPDGRAYVYGYGADLSNLFLIENLR